MLDRAKRASHIDPTASSYSIMRRARPYRGENPAPGKDVRGELDPRPEVENDQDPIRKCPRPRSARWPSVTLKRWGSTTGLFVPQIPEISALSKDGRRGSRAGAGTH